MPVTPNMSLSLPVVSTTTGPEFATMVNAALGVAGDGVDGHDHSPGKGVLVPTAGLNIDAALPFNGADATLLRSTRYSAQSAALADAADLRCIYAVAGNLYWNNASGTAVQITDGASVNAGAGSIAGLPSGTASAAFDGTSFVWRQATNQAAPMDVGPLAIRHTTASALAVTLQSPTGLAGAYSVTLPAALPGTTSFLRMTSAGVLAADVSSSQGITRSMQEAVGQQVSASCEDATTTSGTFANVANLAVTLTTSGRPVLLALVPDGGVVSAQFTSDGALATGSLIAGGALQILVTGSATATIGAVSFLAETTGGAATDGTFKWPGTFTTLYAPAAGTYTFTVQHKMAAGATVFKTQYMKLAVWEL